MSNSQSEYFDYNWLLPSLGWAGPCYTERKQRTRRPSAVHRCWAAHGHRWIPTWMEGLKDVGEEREKSETSLNSPGGAWSIKSAATLTWKYSWLIPTEFSALQFTMLMWSPFPHHSGAPHSLQPFLLQQRKRSLKYCLKRFRQGNVMISHINLRISRKLHSGQFVSMIVHFDSI